MSARPVSLASDEGCMANTKEIIFSDGSYKEKHCCCVPGCDKTSERSCVFADNI